MLRGEKADRIEPPRRRKHHLCSSAVDQLSETRKQLLIDDVWKFIVRSAKKRFLSRATAFDFVLVVLIGAVAARAMTGGAPYFPSLLALMVLVWMHWAISAVTRDWPAKQTDNGKFDAIDKARASRRARASRVPYVDGRS
jgi:hypothetical protein